jgi:hypothetical protein
VWYKEKQTPEQEAKAREHLDREKLFLALDPLRNSGLFS